MTVPAPGFRGGAINSTLRSPYSSGRGLKLTGGWLERLTPVSESSSGVVGSRQEGLSFCSEYRPKVGVVGRWGQLAVGLRMVQGSQENPLGPLLPGVACWAFSPRQAQIKQALSDPPLPLHPALAVLRRET